MTRLSADTVVGFVGAFLRPVVRFCVRHSFSYSEFTKLAKHIYFESAEEEMRSQGHEVSVSRISALTGLDRRDISRFHKAGSFFVRKDNLLSRVIGQWENDPRFSRGLGKAKDLTCESTASEFFELVQTVSKDLNPYTVLGELDRIGAVERLDGRVKLKAKVFVPRADLEDGLRILGLDAGDLFSTVEENLIVRPDSPHLHIRTEYDNLDPDALEDIRQWLLEKGTALHQEIRKYLSRHDKDLNPKIERGGGRAVLGSFALVEKTDEDNS